MIKRLAFLIASAPLLCIFGKEAPGAYKCAVLDRVFEVAISGSSKSGSALAVLERVAEGSAQTVSAASEALLGLKPGEFQDRSFTDTVVRSHAFRRIGESGLPGTLDFLEAVDPSGWGQDETQQVWPDVQVALREAKLMRIPDPSDRVQFLENTVTERHDPISNSLVISWAVDQLCDSSSRSSLPVIERSIRRWNPTGRGEEDIRFCYARMDVVTRHTDRAKALGSVLSVATSAYDQRLTHWALRALAAMRSPDADAEMDRFAVEIEKLPDGSSQKQQLLEFSQSVRVLRRKALE